MIKIQSPFRKLYNSINGKTPITVAEMACELIEAPSRVPLYLFDSENGNMIRVTSFQWNVDAKIFEVGSETSEWAQQFTVAKARKVIDDCTESAEKEDSDNMLDCPVLDEFGNSIVDAYALDDAFLLVSAW